VLAGFDLLLAITANNAVRIIDSTWISRLAPRETADSSAFIRNIVFQRSAEDIGAAGGQRQSNYNDSRIASALVLSCAENARGGGDRRVSARLIKYADGRCVSTRSVVTPTPLKVEPGYFELPSLAEHTPPLMPSVKCVHVAVFPLSALADESPSEELCPHAIITWARARVKTRGRRR